MNATAEAKLTRFSEQLARLREEVGKIVVGQDDVLNGVLTCLLAGGHVLLEGVPGLGKTALVRTLAAALGLKFARIQFTPDLMPADIVGTNFLSAGDQGQSQFEFQPGPIFANLVLADEINRTTPKTQSALLEAMQEHSVTVARTTHTLEEPFFVLATQNPLEMEGTYPLPEAQLDRFLLKLHVPFPSQTELHAILDRTTSGTEASINPVLSKQDVLDLRETARQVAVAPHVRDYVVRILEATHPERPPEVPLVKRYVRYGASPRGAQACLLAGKVRALLQGRFHVAEEDIHAVAIPAMRHRIILSFEGEADGITTDRVLAEVIERVPSKSRG